MTRLLAASGSLRKHSSNTALLRALTLLAPAGMEVALYEGLALLPPFNPDLDVEPCPGPVIELREALRKADAVLISTPEYAHGLPGTLKNALDWLVGSGELSEKPVALIHASDRGQHAQASLREVLRTMNADLLSPELTVSLQGAAMDGPAIARDAELGPRLRTWLAGVGSMVEKRR